MTSIRLLAPAKVNLFLKILNKRPDGYHDILTLFDRISLADRITISKIPEGIVVSSDRFITHRQKENLAYKAAALILERGRVKGGLRIKIEKRIPIAAGLGGGSSDAAAVLMGVNRLCSMRLSPSVLLRLAGRLGADIPFFMLNSPFAVGRSRGDKLEKLPLKIRPWHLVVNPGFGVSTKAIYEKFDASQGLTKKRRNAKIHPVCVIPADFAALESMLHNDLEKAAIAEEKLIGGMIERLAYTLRKKAIVSGSGPSVFCLYRTRKEAKEAKRKFLISIPAGMRKLWKVFIAESM